MMNAITASVTLHDPVKFRIHHLLTINYTINLHNTPLQKLISLIPAPFHSHESRSQFWLGEESVMKQSPLYVKMLLSRNIDDVKRPQRLGHEHLGLHPRHLAAEADARPEAEDVHALQMVVLKCAVVERVVARQPELRAVVLRVMVVARISAQGKDTRLDVRLLCECLRKLELCKSVRNHR